MGRSLFGHQGDPFVSSLLLAVHVKLPEFNATELSDNMWAVAKLGIRDEAFMSSWLLAAHVMLPEYAAQELANSLWASAKLGTSKDEPFLSKRLLSSLIELAQVRW